MKLLSAILIATLAAVVPLAAQERKDEVSTSGKIATHVVESKDGAEVFISEANQADSAAQKLCDVLSVSATKVSVAPDDSWIIVRRGGASVGISFAVFKREKGMIYKELPETDIVAVLLAAACGGDKAKIDQMDHVTADIIEWSGDSKSVLAVVAARGGETRVPPYFAIYRLADGKLEFDLSKFNAAKR